MNENSNGLKGIILVSGILIAGSLTYLGYNLSNYCSAVQNLCSSSTSSTDTDADFNIRVENAIEAYIDKQEELARQEQEEANKPKKVEGVSAGDAAVWGDPNAPVTIVEFSDFECPYCKKNFLETIPQLQEDYIDTGKVKYVFRHYPLPFHEPLATLEALASECARSQGNDETFYAFHDALYNATESNNGITEEEIYNLADTLKLNKTKLKACVENKDTQARVDADIAAAAEFGVQGTPNFFINGWQLKGAYPYASFKEIIEQELAATAQ
jgi:protein-disulfide isomerase